MSEDSKPGAGRAPDGGHEIEISPHLESLGPDVVAKVVEKYLANIVQMEEAMHRAVATGDAEALGDAAHNLRGSSGTVGIQSMVDVCRDLEHLSKTGEVTGAEPHLEKLRGEHRRVREGLAHYAVDETESQ